MVKIITSFLEFMTAIALKQDFVAKEILRANLGEIFKSVKNNSQIKLSQG